MAHSHRDGGRRGAYSVAVAAVVVLLVGVTVLLLGLQGEQTTDTTTAARPSSTPGGARGPGTPTADSASPGAPDGAAPEERPDFGPALPWSPPVALTIPSIGVRTGTMVDLGLAADGTIEVPKDPADPGWFTPGPSPGQVGPAVIAGHVDSKNGPAVFYRLGQLRPDDRIHVTREDGSTATFAVRQVKTYDKDAFPTRAVYGTTNRAELRLITCSGEYDPERGYLANTVVYAQLV